jgi:hypothetical protein
MYSHMLQQRAKHFSVEHQVESAAAASPSKQRKTKTK